MLQFTQPGSDLAAVALVANMHTAPFVYTPRQKESVNTLLNCRSSLREIAERNDQLAADPRQPAGLLPLLLLLVVDRRDGLGEDAGLSHRDVEARDERCSACATRRVSRQRVCGRHRPNGLNIALHGQSKESVTSAAVTKRHNDTKSLRSERPEVGCPSEPAATATVAESGCSTAGSATCACVYATAAKQQQHTTVRSNMKRIGRVLVTADGQTAA